MAQSPAPVADSSATGNIPPLRASFLRHLHAENRSPSTRTTYAKAVDQLEAFLAASGMPTAVGDPFHRLSSTDRKRLKASVAADSRDEDQFKLAANLVTDLSCSSKSSHRVI